MRLSIDVGGTFTDLVVEQAGVLQSYKSPSVAADPVQGILDVLAVAAQAQGVERPELLGACDLFIHATTRATNAVLTGQTSKTAFLTTSGHPDVLLYREGGRLRPFDNKAPYPEPFVPRRLTFEVPERIHADGTVARALDESAVAAIARRLAELDVEAVGVCLLWSIVNPVHERRVGELLAEHLPGIPCSLSHEVNPSVREYRRASSTCIDASLKPIMSAYLMSLQERLRAEGFAGRLLTVTSQAGVCDVPALAGAPIHSINSGPAMAPVAGKFYAAANQAGPTAIVADTGGTSYDVSLVRNGRIPWTRETWLGERLRGHMTGFPSVDVRSVGAGGGSIAWVDEGGMLHVGPQSAGARPGPACYPGGGDQATVTDAALVLGYLDPGYFLDGAIKLDPEAAAVVIKRCIAERLALDVQQAAAAVISVVTQNMVHAIEDITINQGIDPREATLVGGGGAAGLNSVLIARRLGCQRVLVPALSATLSATGALMSDLSVEHSATSVTASEGFDFERVNQTLDGLRARCESFVRDHATDGSRHQIDFFMEARYPHQVWEIEVPLERARFDLDTEVAELVEAFHDTHQEMFAISDRDSPVEMLSWKGRARCALWDAADVSAKIPGIEREPTRRDVYFLDGGIREATVRPWSTLTPGVELQGPAIIEAGFTTVVIDPGAVAQRSVHGDLSITI